MKIEATCPCGATLTLEDDNAKFINGGGKPDEQGRVYRVEVSFDKWQADHKGCKTSANLRKVTR